MASTTILEPKKSPKPRLVGSRRKKQWKELKSALPFMLFGLFGVGVFVLYPMFKGIYISLFKYNIIPDAESPFVGLDNYIRAFKDPNFYLSLRNTLLYGIVTVPGQWIIGLLLAVLINAPFVKHKVFFRTIYYIPVITSWVIVGYLFKYLFADGENGFINYIFYKKLGLLSEPVSWLQNEWTAMIVIWILGIWKGIGWVMVIYLAALQGIPRSLYEAAEIDGGKAWQILLNVTIPLLKPATLFIIINLIIGSFNVFLQVYLITNGGPLGRTEVLLSYMYKQAFQFYDFGYASAISVIMGIMIMIITWRQQKSFTQDKVQF